MRQWTSLLASVLLLLMPGCLVDEADEGDDGDSWNDWADDGSFDGRTEVVLGDRSVFTPGPGTFGFTANVPEGGATNVYWSLQFTGASADSRVEGPGCENGVLAGSVGTSRVSGMCGDLPEGEHQFRVVLNAAAVEFTAEVHGMVLA